MEINGHNGLMRSLDFQKEGHEWHIPVDSLCIRRRDDPSNPGTILELYRSLRDEGRHEKASDLLVQNMPLINDLINRFSLSLSPEPDYIQVFHTSDIPRNEILGTFRAKVIGACPGLKVIADRSEYFSKVDEQLSVRHGTGDLAEKSLNYNYIAPPDQAVIRNLWLIDDTIDRGTTIEIFLNKLYSNGLLDPNTSIRAFILYNNSVKDPGFKGLHFNEIKKRHIDL